MNIGIVGMGKMGQAVARLSKERGHTVTLTLDLEQMQNFFALTKDLPDCWIEFSAPEAAFQNIEILLTAQRPIVTGTTGWYERIEELQAKCIASQTPVLYSPNFSLGIAVLQKLNQYLAQLMQPYAEYDCAITETHHNQKMDAPSGTALALAQTLINNYPRKKSIVPSYELARRSPMPHELVVTSNRVGRVIGNHEIIYNSAYETLTLAHYAHSRDVFAIGALKAAEWLVGKPANLYHFYDILPHF
jgi:4-hydroxy-tetrahydrodipicolinate reductase